MCVHTRMPCMYASVAVSVCVCGWIVCVCHKICVCVAKYVCVHMRGRTHVMCMQRKKTQPKLLVQCGGWQLHFTLSSSLCLSTPAVC